MTERLFILGLVLLLVVGCKWTASTAGNIEPRVTVDAPRSENASGISEPTPAATPKSQPVQAANAVCPDPAKPCHHKEKHFDDWELSFRMPAKMAVNKTYSSAPFYALVLKTYSADDDCDGGEYVEAIESERKQLQHAEPGHKAFASYQCPNMGAVDYEFEGKWDAKKENLAIGHFLAIYAGETKEQADELLKKLGPKFPNASVKRMTAGYEIIDQ